eukprot:6782622-Karenia_brevis.AAC.1
METKTEVSTGELKSEVEEVAPHNDAEAATNASGPVSMNAPGSALTQVKQETHTGSVFETSKSYDRSDKTE